MIYASLVEQIGRFLNRQDLAAQIPTFIELAEAQLNRKVRHRLGLVRAVNSFDEHFLALPLDFLEAKNVQLDTEPPVALRYITMEQADVLRGTSHAGSGQPVFYTIIGNQLESIPVSNGEYPIELTYYARVNPLGLLNDSNWLLAISPDSYLFGSLLQAAPYLDADERVPVWDGLYQRAINELNDESRVAEISGSALRIRNRVSF